ncbi:hypothetical protein CCH79_00020639 [Gambusia affinis]|uniref:Uncharacterized protein n=1 Tax=Gambusia affinis TaxID=33528 RepID=A0A315V8U4_GAMAF|nr:hypothetical protein CCH79_00020639 [Gambusia affinis]
MCTIMENDVDPLESLQFSSTRCSSTRCSSCSCSENLLEETFLDGLISSLVPGRAESEFIAMVSDSSTDDVSVCCQAQLLELRTQNYQLSDDLRKNSAELNAVRLKLSVLERDLVRAQKAVNKSKKAQEVEALLSENEMLQGKLHSQEDDFRLQNSTLMAELSKLCTQIEQLETENRRLQEGGGASGPPADSTHGPADGELLRLQAENAALHKKLRTLQERSDGELQKVPIAHGDQSVATETDGPAGTNGIQSGLQQSEQQRHDPPEPGLLLVLNKARFWLVLADPEPR